MHESLKKYLTACKRPDWTGPALWRRCGLARLQVWRMFLAQTLPRRKTFFGAPRCRLLPVLDDILDRLKDENFAGAAYSGCREALFEGRVDRDGAATERALVELAEALAAALPAAGAGFGALVVSGSRGCREISIPAGSGTRVLEFEVVPSTPRVVGGVSMIVSPRAAGADGIVPLRDVALPAPRPACALVDVDGAPLPVFRARPRGDEIVAFMIAAQHLPAPTVFICQSDDVFREISRAVGEVGRRLFVIREGDVFRDADEGSPVFLWNARQHPAAAVEDVRIFAACAETHYRGGKRFGSTCCCVPKAGESRETYVRAAASLGRIWAPVAAVSVTAL